MSAQLNLNSDLTESKEFKPDYTCLRADETLDDVCSDVEVSQKEDCEWKIIGTLEPPRLSPLLATAPEDTSYPPAFALTEAYLADEHPSRLSQLVREFPEGCHLLERSNFTDEKKALYGTLCALKSEGYLQIAEVHKRHFDVFIEQDSSFDNLCWVKLSTEAVRARKRARTADTSVYEKVASVAAPIKLRKYLLVANTYLDTPAQLVQHQKIRIEQNLPKSTNPWNNDTDVDLYDLKQKGFLDTKTVHPSDLNFFYNEADDVNRRRLKEISKLSWVRLSRKHPPLHGEQLRKVARALDGAADVTSQNQLDAPSSPPGRRMTTPSCHIRAPDS
jgi:hypothetical protein